MTYVFSPYNASSQCSAFKYTESDEESQFIIMPTFDVFPFPYNYLFIYQGNIRISLFYFIINMSAETTSAVRGILADFYTYPPQNYLLYYISFEHNQI